MEKFSQGSFYYKRLNKIFAQFKYNYIFILTSLIFYINVT